MAALPPPMKTSVRQEEWHHDNDNSMPGPPPLPSPNPAPAQYAEMVRSFFSSAPAKILGWFGIVFGVLWVMFGIAGFIMSFICFGYTGNVGEKLLGVVLAVVLGPWYWLYYYSSSSYCKATPPTFF